MSLHLRELLMRELSALRHEPIDGRTYCLPREEVRTDLLPSDKRTFCAYEGEASYLSHDVAWYYPAPLREAAEVTGRIACFTALVDIEVDGERLERPVTPWSRRRRASDGFTSGPGPRRLARMADRDLLRFRDEQVPRPDRPAEPAAPSAHPLLALQQTAGNQAVQRLIAGLGGKDVLPEAVADPPENELAQGGRAQSPTLQRNGDDAAKADAGTPPNLTKKTVSGPTSEKHGGFKWVVQWELDKPSPKGGVIIQKVNAVHDIKSKDGDKLTTGFDKWVPYWEAWEINRDKKVTTYAQTGDVEDDTFSKGSSPDGSRGTFEEKGSARFYEGAKLPASMKPERKSPAGILPFSQSDPALEGGSSALAHELKATWDGVKGDGTTTVTTV